MRNAAVRTCFVQVRSVVFGWGWPVLLFATCGLWSCGSGSTLSADTQDVSTQSLALPALPSPGDAPRRQNSQAIISLTGDQLYAQSAGTESDPLLHTASLDAAASADTLNWAVYELTGLAWEQQPWILGVDAAGEAPDHYWLGVADYAAQCWRWTQVQPAASEHTVLIAGILQPVQHDTTFVAFAVDAECQLTIRGLSLVAGCAGSTAGYGCDLNGQAHLYEGWQIAWGDLHAHSAFSGDAANEYNEGCTVEPAAACAYARDVAQLDFVAITDHAELQGVGDYSVEKWQATLQQEQQLNILFPSERDIIIFPGFEYTKPGNFFGLTYCGGHKTVLFRDFLFAPPRVYGCDALESPYDLWKWLDNTVAAHNYITIPHHPAKGGMQTDWSPYCMNPMAQPVVEMYSRHGSSESIYANDERVFDFVGSSTAGAATAAWLIDHNPAYKLGFIAATDGHQGEPGNVSECAENMDPRIGRTTGGLAAVWVPAITRDDLWAGLLQKNCYATSGARLYVEFTAKLGEQLAPMGGTLYHQQSLNDEVCAMVNLHIRVAGDEGRRISRILLFKDGVPHADWHEAGWGSIVHLDYTDLLETDYAFYRIKVWQDKAVNPLPDNDSCERAWSSPIWIEPAQVN